MGADQKHVFVNRHGQTLTRDGVAYILQKYAAAAAAEGRQDRLGGRRPRVRLGGPS